MLTCGCSQGRVRCRLDHFPPRPATFQPGGRPDAAHSSMVVLRPAVCFWPRGLPEASGKGQTKRTQTAFPENSFSHEASQAVSSPAVPLPSLASLRHRRVPDIVQEQACVQQGPLQPTPHVPPGVWDVVLPLQSLAAAIGGPCIARASKRKCPRRLQRRLDGVPSFITHQSKGITRRPYSPP